MPPDRTKTRNHPHPLTLSGWAPPPSDNPPPQETQPKKKETRWAIMVRELGWTAEQSAKQMDLRDEYGFAYHWRTEILEVLHAEQSEYFHCPLFPYCKWETDLREYDIKDRDGEKAHPFHAWRKQRAYDLFMKHLEDQHMKPDGVKWESLKGYRILKECDPQPYVPHPDYKMPACSLETDT
ncbi:hypothetical protein V5O48_014768 [Marasmius crinis-equi]|uniref:Uncharacterized protein n=1 Tax=Marasmius crinis-equi TaxID=585013 RepID=A0ABR3EWC8_9AGAR